jgi:short-subunit dehydrogenase
MILTLVFISISIYYVYLAHYNLTHSLIFPRTFSFSLSYYLFLTIIGLYSDSSIETIMSNYECNATAPASLAHYFSKRLIALPKAGTDQRRGAITFTSSPASLMPCPTTVMYGATKAFLTEFATSLAAELYADSVDVLVVNPSPVNTAFYSGNKHSLSAMKFFQRTATSPAVIADCFFKSLGRSIVCDQGYFCLMFKILLKIVEVNFLAWIMARTSAGNADYKKLVAQRKKD